jgi:hypothetical protein
MYNMSSAVISLLSKVAIIIIVYNKLLHTKSITFVSFYGLVSFLLVLRILKKTISLNQNGMVFIGLTDMRRDTHQSSGSYGYL